MRLERAGPLWRQASQVVLALFFAAVQGGPLAGEVVAKAPKPPVERLTKGVAERETKALKASAEKAISATLERSTKVPKPPVERMTKG